VVGRPSTASTRAKYPFRRTSPATRFPYRRVVTDARGQTPPHAAGSKSVHQLLRPYTHYALALLRIVAGFLFLCHGAQKFGLIDDTRSTAAPPSQARVVDQAPSSSPQLTRDVLAPWTERLRLPAGRRLVAGSIELIGGTLMMVGLLTSSIAFLASGLMASAYFMVHAPQGFFPLLNGGEPAVLFCFIWLYLSTVPSTRFAVDNVIAQRRDNRSRGAGCFPALSSEKAQRVFGNSARE